MADTKTVTAKPTVDVNTAPSMEAHQNELLKRADVRAKKQPKLREMLDASAASFEEQRKLQDKYRVSCTLNIREAGKMEANEKSGVVTAQNEDDAWAVFCDQMKHWPSPNWCDRKIEKV